MAWTPSFGESKMNKICITDPGTAKEAVHMNKDFEREYAKIVTNFVQKVPSDYTITYGAMDGYFRKCILFLSNGNAEVAVPDFFRQMVSVDLASGTHRCCDFIRAQREVLMLYASLEETFSFEESRRLAFLNDRLMVICEQEGVKEAATLGSGETNISQDAVKSLNSLLEESASIVFKNQRGTTPRYVRHTEVERETEAESLLNAAREIEQRIDREIEAKHPIKELGSQKDNVALYLSDAMHGKKQTDDLVQVSVPDWVQKAIKTQRERRSSEEKRNNEGTKPSLEEALAELNSMIGLDSVKSQVQSLMDYIKICKMREKHGSKSRPMSYHLILTGNPGTGKSTVAQIIAKIYAALGILRKGQLVEVARKDLVGEYVGKTEKKTRKIIKKALGGVLFIDEAYLLSSKDDKKDYGQIAIGTILKAMEDHRDDLVVIVAGYDNLMGDFIESNPGLKSRFATKIFFEDYNEVQLYQIFQKMVRADYFHLSIPAETMAKVYFGRMYQNRNKADFGNGRDVRNSYEKLCMIQATRLAKMGRKPTEEELYTFTGDDIIYLINKT